MSEVRPLPKWLTKRHAKLWKAFRDDEFTFDEAVGVLGDDSRIVSILLSELNKNGWIQSIRQHPDDSRKKIYKLTNLEKGYVQMAKMEQAVR